MISYTEALSKIHSLLQFGSRPGLDRIQKLLTLIGNPQKSLKYIHVAGTNGKGSVCAVLSSVLTQSGNKTGLFISPYITDFCERIQINETPVSHTLLCEAVEYIFPFVLEMKENDEIITEFEFITAVAFYCFKKENCDIVVLETGLGGLLDCTNVIDAPLCSVITSISFDHTAILGNTLSEIAMQKCGIIKENSITVFSKQEKSVCEIIKSTAKAKHNAFYEADESRLSNIRFENDKTTFNFSVISFTLSLLGEHQIQNALTALTALFALKENKLINFSTAALQKGVENAKNPARFEIISKKPLVILDGAHNPDGVLSFKNGVIRYGLNDKKILIIGMLKDKDSDSAILHLKNLFDEIYCVPVDNPRSDNPEVLKQKFERFCDNVTAFDNPFKAIDKALCKLKNKDYSLFICGSLYLAGQIRPYLIKNCDNTF